MEPCENTLHAGHIILACFNGVGVLLTIWLAHTRKQADWERRQFEADVRKTLDLPTTKRDEKVRADRLENGR